MKRHTLTIVWEGQDIDDATNETLCWIADEGYNDLGLLFRMGGIDVVDPNEVTVRLDEER